MTAIETKRDRPLILIADDDITVRLFACDHLQAEGFEVVAVENGALALDEFVRLKPDAVVLDIQMPQLNGYETCAAIKALPTGANTPILMMTAREDIEAINNCYSAGANEFTSKPVNWTAESHRLNNMIEAAEAVTEIDVSRRQWEQTFNAVDEIITIHAPDLRIVAANQAAATLAGNPDEGLANRSCQDVFCKSADACEDCLLQKVLMTGEKQELEIVDGCHDGVYLLSVVPIYDTIGNIIRLVRTAKDITEHHRMQAELRRSQKMDAVGMLAGGLSHDFNNILQTIVAYADIASRELVEPAGRAAEYLKELVDVAIGGSAISRQLLTLARKDESKKRPVALNTVIELVCGVLRRTMPQMVEIEYSLAPDLCNINADSSQLEQVLMNLAVNANHAMPEGGRLFIETRNTTLDKAFCLKHPEVCPGSYTQFSIKDTGCGMDQGTMQKIFEPFFTTRTNGKGTGLGLAMVVGIIQKHDGAIICESTPGQGTTFTVYLPISDQEVEAEEKPADIEIVRGQGETVLLVDDDLAIRNLGTILMTNAGYEVLLAVDGEHALEMFKENREQIDLVILDLNMPRMGGLECLDHLRELDPHLPILVASGFPVTEDQRDHILSTADYITKPYHHNQLLNRVHQSLTGVDTPQLAAV